jgi:carboxylesterase
VGVGPERREVIGGIVSVLPGAEPFSHPGGQTGVLLCHGFTGSPQSLRPWAQALAGAGHSVLLPRLPGHGTTWQEMNRTRWQDWYATVESALVELRSTCRTVVVGGLSMGAALALRLAEQRGDDVDGLLLVNPAVKAQDPRLRLLPALRHLLPSLPGIGSDIKKPGATELAYDRTPLQALYSLTRAWPALVADLPRVGQPVLLFRSAHDHVVPASSSALVLERISSADVTEILCEDSFHVATLDNDAERIEKESLAFVERIAARSLR